MQDEVIVLTADRDLWKGICRNRDGAHAGQITELRASLATRESALRALVAQWRENAEAAVETGYYARMDTSETYDKCADALERLLSGPQP